MPSWYRLCADVDALGVRSPELARIAATNKAQGAADVRAYLALIVARLAPDAGDRRSRGRRRGAGGRLRGLAVRKLLDDAFDIDEAYLAIERMRLARWAPGVAPVRRRWSPERISCVEEPFLPKCGDRR